MTEDHDARRRIDRLLAEFRQYVLDNAREERAFLPAYDLWLDRVAAAIRDGTEAPSRDETIVSQAEAQIAPFRYAKPPFRDLLTWAAIVEETHLGTLGAGLAATLAEETDSVRRDATTYLRDRYALGWGGAVDQAD